MMTKCTFNDQATKERYIYALLMCSFCILNGTYIVFPFEGINKIELCFNF